MQQQNIERIVIAKYSYWKPLLNFLVLLESFYIKLQVQFKKVFYHFMTMYSHTCLT